MRRILLALAILLFGGSIALAQVFSNPGIFDHGGDIPNYNHAYEWIGVQAVLPGQVEFELPTATLNLSLAHMVPNNVIKVQLRVHNHSDRPIDITDQGFTPDPEVQACGFSVSANEPLRVGAGSDGWFIYTIGVPGQAALAQCIATLETDPSFAFDGFSGYDTATNTIVVKTRLEAEGVIDSTPATSAVFDFP